MGVCGTKQMPPAIPADLGKDPLPTVLTADAQTPGKRSGSLSNRHLKVDGISHAQFILSNPGKIREIYEIEDKRLGDGTYGFVQRATHKSTGVQRAIKTVAKGHMKNVERFKQEIEIMKVIDHPHIIKLFETFEDHKNIYFVMELCTGGELFDCIISAGHFTEVDAAVAVQHILRAIFYIHENGISHRDLKPENFLFLTQEPIQKNVLKLIDFGLSCWFNPGDTLTTKAGTPYYVAPQVLQGRYDRMCDLWSCGVIMYTLLCGYPPFYGRNDQDVLQKVRAGNFHFDDRHWKHISDDAKGLIKHLLKMNPRERYTAEQALNHDWILHKAPRATNVSLHKSLVENLTNFRTQSKMKKAALHIIAGQLNEAQIRELREIFTALDTNGDGLLTQSELEEGFGKAGLRDLPVNLQQIMDGVDADGSGAIDYTEFLAATLDRKSYLKEDVCWTAFSVFDLDGDGRISKEELQKVLDNGGMEEVVGSQSAAELLQDIDRDGDGTIDFAEFMDMMKGGRSKNDHGSEKSTKSRRSEAARSPPIRRIGGA